MEKIFSSLSAQSGHYCELGYFTYLAIEVIAFRKTIGSCLRTNTSYLTPENYTTVYSCFRFAVSWLC